MAHRVMHMEFAVVALAGLLLPVVAPLKNRRVGRRMFWGGLLVACVSAFFIAYPPDWKLGIGMSIFVAVTTVFTAYFNSPYIKIRGKIYALHIEDSRPDASPDSQPAPSRDDHDLTADSYGGGITAKKFWWLTVPVIAMFTFPVIVVDKEKPWTAPLMVALIVVGAISLGSQDAICQYPIARGQRVQCVLVSVVTLGVFIIFYLGAYNVSKRWLLRRQQSGEYRTPRHQKRYP
jgi:hypothetical protein